MELRPSLMLPAVIKALQDVLVPALDPANKLAHEQAHLVIATLQLLVQREPLRYRYERDELSRFVALAKSLQKEAGGLPCTESALRELTGSVAASEDVFERARAEPGELEAANIDVRDKVCALVNALYSNNPASSLKSISSLITAHAQVQLRKERAWIVSQGWEADPSSLAPIETQLDEVTRR